MKIRKIYAKNYRTLVDFSADFDDGYCTISGKNNAGKSSLIKILENFLEDDDKFHFFFKNQYNFDNERTKWLSEDETLIGIEINIKREFDSEFFFFVEKMAPSIEITDNVDISLERRLSKDEKDVSSCSVNENPLDYQTSTEILKRLKSSPNIFFHDSPSQASKNLYKSRGLIEMTDVQLSSEDRKKVAYAQTQLRNKVRQVAKGHKEALAKLIGKLNEQYDVNLTVPEGYARSDFPLAVTLVDKPVEVALEDWGSGTQNRTHILMSILQASRLKSSSTGELGSVTPVVVIEEPESFLHPTAQGEFGQILTDLSDELGIQIIATTHSPFMLNQRHPKSNILIERKEYRKKLKESFLVDTSGENWMVPHSEILGVIPNEFKNWKSAITGVNSKVIFVEGQIDVDYFNCIKEKFPDFYSLPHDIEIESYGGKDALKNTRMLQFVVGKLDKYFITYDLDCDDEVAKRLESIGLKRDVDFCCVGLSKPGKDCIEGLLPDAIVSKVLAENHEYAMALGSTNSTERKNSKNKLKNKFYEELNKGDPKNIDLSKFKKMFDKIAKKFK